MEHITSHQFDITFNGVLMCHSLTMPMMSSGNDTVAVNKADEHTDVPDTPNAEQVTNKACTIQFC